ncbi:MAG: hypothetical protein H6734_20800 [Alphaproteobacteria bacterium]|nr:hypothetical protein [Alphaproteobacteria bacterium]
MTAPVLLSSLLSPAMAYTPVAIPNLPVGTPIPDEFDGSWAVADLVGPSGTGLPDGEPDLVVYGKPRVGFERFLSIVPGRIGVNTTLPVRTTVLPPDLNAPVKARVTRALLVGDVDNDGADEILQDPGPPCTTSTPRSSPTVSRSATPMATACPTSSSAPTAPSCTSRVTGQEAWTPRTTTSPA